MSKELSKRGCSQYVDEDRQIDSVDAVDIPCIRRIEEMKNARIVYLQLTIVQQTVRRAILNTMTPETMQSKVRRECFTSFTEPCETRQRKAALEGMPTKVGNE